MASPPEIPPKRATTVKFARKTSSGRYVSLSREDLDSKNYTVQMPPTPDNQPMDDEESSVMHEPLYGGIPRPQIITKSVDKSSACGMPECDQIVMQDTHGYDIYPCDCRFEDKTEWGDRVGWIYGSVTEDVVTGYRMHNRGWRSIYCVTKRDAFRGSAPINLTDRLHQVLRWATGSVEIFFSRNNALFASKNMELLQRIAYLNVGIYPFTSIFLLVYCFLPALSLFSDQFIVQTLSVTFLVYLLTITLTLVLLAVLEVKWSGVGLEEWWWNEQFWLISGTSAHLYAVIQGLLKVVAGIEISFTLTSKLAAPDDDDDADAFADLYVVKWTSLMMPPITIMMVNLIAVKWGSQGQFTAACRSGGRREWERRTREMTQI